MWKVIQHFGKHCSCHVQGEYVLVGHFWKPYVGQAVGGKLNAMVPTGGVEECDAAVRSSAPPVSTITFNFTFTACPT
jgi:hypothetical protein